MTKTRRRRAAVAVERFFLEAAIIIEQKHLCMDYGVHISVHIYKRTYLYLYCLPHVDYDDAWVLLAVN